MDLARNVSFLSFETTYNKETVLRGYDIICFMNCRLQFTCSHRTGLKNKLIETEFMTWIKEQILGTFSGKSCEHPTSDVSWDGQASELPRSMQQVPNRYKPLGSSLRGRWGGVGVSLNSIEGHAESARHPAWGAVHMGEHRLQGILPSGPTCGWADFLKLQHLRIGTTVCSTVVQKTLPGYCHFRCPRRKS